MDPLVAAIIEQRDRLRAAQTAVEAEQHLFYKMVAEACDAKGQSAVARELGVSRQYVHELVTKHRAQP